MSSCFVSGTILRSHWGNTCGEKTNMVPTLVELTDLCGQQAINYIIGRVETNYVRL